MLMSFIIPALNEASTIASCIKSIQKQISPDDEIIVVDNGSHDDTVKIAQSTGCTVVSETKRGISHARNNGAKIAKNDILCFIDADGMLSQNWIKNALESLSHKNIVAVSGLNIFWSDKPFKKIAYNTYTIGAYCYV